MRLRQPLRNTLMPPDLRLPHAAKKPSRQTHEGLAGGNVAMMIPLNDGRFLPVKCSSSDSRRLQGGRLHSVQKLDYKLPVPPHLLHLRGTVPEP